MNQHFYNIFTAETQRAQRESFFLKKLCALCVSAVSIENRIREIY